MVTNQGGRLPGSALPTAMRCGARSATVSGCLTSAAYDGSPRQCRICLSEEEDLGGLVAPCDCSGSMRYVHARCLRTWRMQGGWRTAIECPVCRTAYRDHVGQWERALRPLLLCPVASVAGAGAALLWLMAPGLHRHAGGAAWMYAAAPLQHRLDLWRPWEDRGGMLCGLARWLFSGTLVLLLPALADHATAALSGSRTTVARASELVLLLQLCGRMHFLVQAAWVRSFEGTRIGLLARRRCSQTIAEALDQVLGGRGPTATPTLVTALSDLSRRYAAGGLTTLWKLHATHGTDKDARLLQLLLRARTRTEVSMLLADSKRVWWWPQVLLWYWAEQEIPATMLARATAIGALLTTSAGPALSSLGITETQAQAVLFSILTLLCSAFRGAYAVRVWVLRFSVT